MKYILLISTIFCFMVGGLCISDGEILRGVICMVLVVIGIVVLRRKDW